jgi:hypothetical protein
MAGTIGNIDDAWCAGGLLPLAAAAVGLVGLAVLLVARKHVAGTTLHAAWWWLVAGTLGLMGAELAALATTGGEGAAGLAALRYAAATATICAPAAVLGGKRPQHGIWQFVVLSLWVVAALPAAVAWIQPPPSRDWAVSPAWQWLIAAAILMGVANYLGTRFALPAILYGAAQAILLCRHLPLAGIDGGNAAPLAGMALLVAAIAWAAWGGWPLRSRAAAGEHRLWLDFRDAFGVSWSLRVAERVNATAASEGWKTRLGWNGFLAVGDDERPSAEESSAAAAEEAPPPHRAAATKLLRTLLLRFVSPEWIAVRTGQALD